MSATQSSEAVNDLEGTPDGDRTLVALIRAAFPHEGVPDAAYERAAAEVKKRAEQTPWMRIKLASGLDSLEGLVEGRVVNRITVADDVARDARLALDRMLALP